MTACKNGSRTELVHGKSCTSTQHYVTFECDHTQACHSLAPEESDVEDGGIEVDKLEDVEFGDEAVFVLCCCAVEFCEE